MLPELSLPPIADKPDPGLEVRPVFVEEWVESLPYANPVALLEQLLERLRRTNRAPIKPQQRLALLETFLVPYLFLLDVREKSGPIHGIAAFERHRADTEAARRIAAEMALGYKTVVSEGGRRRALWGGQRERRLAVQRSILFLSLVLLHSYDEYLPIPGEVWPELHALARYAEALGIAEQRVCEAAQRPELAESCAALYRRILLTSLLDPYHLAYGDVWHAYRLLAGHAEAARITPPGDPDRLAGRFVIDPRSHHHPRPLARVRGELAAGSLILDAGPVSERLHRAPAARDAEEARVRAAMLRAYALPPSRHAPRERTEGRVRLTTGVSSLHHFLGGASAALDEGGGRPTESGADLPAEMLDEPTIEEASAHSYTAEFWELIDKGPGGVGVIKRIRPNIAIGVGELIGIQIPAAGHGERDWLVGAVRWLSIAQAGEYQAGVQLLARSAEPIALLDPERPAPIPALALPRLEASPEVTLVTPPGVYREGASLTLLRDGARIEISARRLVERAKGYERFGFAR